MKILMDSEKREIYDKLGPEAATSKHPFNENTMLIEVCKGDAFRCTVPLRTEL